MILVHPTLDLINTIILVHPALDLINTIILVHPTLVLINLIILVHPTSGLLYQFVQCKSVWISKDKHTHIIIHIYTYKGKLEGGGEVVKVNFTFIWLNYKCIKERKAVKNKGYVSSFNEKSYRPIYIFSV